MEIKQFFLKSKSLISSLLLAVVLFLVILAGINSGRTLAKSQIVYTAANNLDIGLKYFYEDQDRFPTVLEFANSSLMLNYFSVFPPLDFPSQVCSQSFVYKRLDSQNFQLDYCLPQGFSLAQPGWNQINGSKAK